MGYSKIELYGEANINYLQVKSGIASTSSVNEVIQKELHLPIWDEDTYMLATYQNSINASSVESMGSPIVCYKIQRYDIEEDVLYQVADTEELKIRDYNVVSNNKYKYYIFPIIKNTEDFLILSSPIITDIIEPKWDGCTIIGLQETDNKNEYIIDRDNIWTFRFNIEQQGYVLNIDKTYKDGFGRFAKLNRGQKKYLTTGMNSLVGEVDCKETTFKSSLSKVEKWEEFCYSSNLKLFKDMNGRVIPCDIKDVTSSYLFNGNDSPVMTSFNIVQLDDRKEISVYEEVSV